MKLRTGILPCVLLLALFLLMPVRVNADVVRHVSIVEDIMADSVNVVVQPAGLADRVGYIAPKAAAPVKKPDSRAGFRVQVYNGMGKTAQSDARARLRQSGSRFPQYRTYLDYRSPYWVARVGDFKTREEANEAAGRIRGAFPSFSKEIRVVSDRISILEQPIKK